MTKEWHDYNPDREGHRGHTHRVIRVNPNKDELMIGGEMKKFDANGTIEVTDPGLVKDLRQTISPWDATVTRINKPHPADRGHTYLFSAPAMPWHEYDEFGRRVK